MSVEGDGEVSGNVVEGQKSHEERENGRKALHFGSR